MPTIPKLVGPLQECELIELERWLTLRHEPNNCKPATCGYWDRVMMDEEAQRRIRLLIDFARAQREPNLTVENPRK